MRLANCLVVKLVNICLYSKCALIKLLFVLDIAAFTKVLVETIDYFKSTKRFNTEAAQLSRLIFMNCKQFRMMKGLGEMKKTHQALLRYLNLDLLTTLETFKGFVSDEGDATVTIPYQPSLDYILIRFQGLSKLFIRTVECCRRSATFFLGLIKAGSFYTKGVVFLSNLASVWSLSREFCKFVVKQYKKLRVFRDILKVRPGSKWVDGDYDLPLELDQWLGDDWSRLIVNETYDVKLLVREADLSNYLNNKDDEMSNVFSLIKVEDTEDASVIEEPAVQMQAEDDSNELEDFTPIPRSIEKDITECEASVHSLSSLKSKESITNFVKNENLYRKVDPKKSLTITKMKKKVWKQFKNDIKVKAVLMQDGAFINYINDYLEEFKIC